MISIEDLSFGYQRDEPILSNIDHVFTAGRMTALTGPSGRGKSTLLYLIGLLLTPWSGAIRFAGEDLSGTSTDDSMMLSITVRAGSNAASWNTNPIRLARNADRRPSDIRPWTVGKPGRGLRC